uniref:Uncharacterized protein n=1 Tax=Oryza sativa subsp. japonica TaxID=39947 RepID=Q10QN5_ORYSJ|nr:hypothetical protein LOC_Os03g09040 [Oryza sativa Japonica Group]
MAKLDSGYALRMLEAKRAGGGSGTGGLAGSKWHFIKILQMKWHMIYLLMELTPCQVRNVKIHGYIEKDKIVKAGRYIIGLICNYRFAKNC